MWLFFFKITVEEAALIKMFGEDYIQFRAKTVIGIPFMANAVNAALTKRGVIGTQ
jgi:protein-S-isoprenylcysteine O-methyltransferase Ste14